LVTAINNKTAQTGVVASADVSGQITLTATDGRNIQIQTDDASGGGLENDINFSLGLQADGITVAEMNYVARGSLSLTSNSASGIQITQDGSTAGNATPAQILGFNGAVGVTATGSGVALSVASVATVDSANLVITGVDNALNTINTIRANLGSYQNRFESVVSSLQTTAENLSASRSRIVDADFASETASLTKAQILQQSGIAMLAQANAIPQNVLALLQ
jgi:flagellin